MAMVLFIPGSLLGLITALALAVGFGASSLVVIMTYCAIAFGTPVAGLFAAYMSCAMKRHAAARDDVDFHNA